MEGCDWLVWIISWAGREVKPVGGEPDGVQLAQQIGGLARDGDTFPLREGVAYLMRAEKFMVRPLKHCEAQRCQGSTGTFRIYNTESY